MTAVALALVLGCGDDGTGVAPEADAGRTTDGAAGDGALPFDGGTGADGGVEVDASGGSEDGGTSADAGTGCGTAGIVPMVAYDMTERDIGEGFLGWRRSVIDDTHASSRAIAGSRCRSPSTSPTATTDGSADGSMTSPWAR